MRLPPAVYRVLPSIVALLLFFGLSALYLGGHRDAYMTILNIYGIDAFEFPFLDIHYSLAAWDCTRLGIDVIEQNPCDVLGRGYTYSPLWMAGSWIPLGSAATPIVGSVLALLFILSLSLLPPARGGGELILVVPATISTMTVFAVERANSDIILFLIALVVGWLAQGALAARLVAYAAALFAALLKYYPVTLLILSFRERLVVFLANGLAMTGLIVLFLVAYLADIERGWPLINHGSYFAEMFAAKNLPFGLTELLFAKSAGAPNPPAAAPIGAVLFAFLLLWSARRCWWLLTRTALHRNFSEISDAERSFLVGGGALIAGCFFAGQSVGYRGIYLLFVLPGLLGVARVAADALSRRLCRTAAMLIVLLMWEEFFRMGLKAIVSGVAMPGFLANLCFLALWLARELAWWWVVSLLLTFLFCFLAESETCRGVLQLSKRYLSLNRTH